MNFLQIVTNQYNLNDLISGKTWLNNPKVDMYQAAVDEAVSELLPSAGWAPWWKGVEPDVDLENCQMEVVDILHFHIGAAIQEAMFEALTSMVNSGEIEEYHDFDSFEAAWKSGTNMLRYTEAERENVCHEVAEAFELQELEERQHLYTRTHREAIQSYVGSFLTYGACSTVSNLLDLAAAFNLQSSDLAMMYMAKHALNEFRTRNNYKGTDKTKPKYQKIWNGVEDNKVLMDWVRAELASGAELTRERVLDFLATEYAKLG